MDGLQAVHSADCAVGATYNDHTVDKDRRDVVALGHVPDSRELGGDGHSNDYGGEAVWVQPVNVDATGPNNNGPGIAIGRYT